MRKRWPPWWSGNAILLTTSLIVITGLYAIGTQFSEVVETLSIGRCSVTIQSHCRLLQCSAVVYVFALRSAWQGKERKAEINMSTRSLHGSGHCSPNRSVVTISWNDDKYALTLDFKKTVGLNELHYQINATLYKFTFVVLSRYGATTNSVRQT